MINPHELALTARSWVGTPYVHQGRGPKGPEGGTDCVGLLIGVAEEVGALEPGYDPTGYDWETDGTQLQEELSRWADLAVEMSGEPSAAVVQSIVREGDLLVFKIVGLPQHTGIASEIDYGRHGTAIGLIHAYNVKGFVVEHLLDERWAKRLFQVWRLRG